MYVFYEKCFVRNDEINKLQQYLPYVYGDVITYPRSPISIAGITNFC